MPYEVDIQPHQNYIRASVNGTRLPGNAVADAVHTWQQIAQACRENDVEKILAVFSVSGRLSPIDSYDIVAKAEEFGWSRAFKLAFVELNQESLEDNLFSETVAVNRAYQLRVFDNEPDAMEWLLNS